MDSHICLLIVTLGEHTFTSMMRTHKTGCFSLLLMMMMLNHCLPCCFYSALAVAIEFVRFSCRHDGIRITVAFVCWRLSWWWWLSSWLSLSLYLLTWWRYGSCSGGGDGGGCRNSSSSTNHGFGSLRTLNKTMQSWHDDLATRCNMDKEYLNRIKLTRTTAIGINEQ